MEPARQGALARAWGKLPPAQMLCDSGFLLDFALGGVSQQMAVIPTYPVLRYTWMCMASPGGKDEGPMGFAKFLVSEAKTNIFSLWRGCLPKMLMYYPKQAFNIIFLDAVRSLLPGTWKRGEWTPPNGVSGLRLALTDTFAHHAASFGPELVAYPLRVMAQVAAVYEPGAPEAAGLSAIMTAPGLLGLWNGFCPYFLGLVIKRAVGQLLPEVLPSALSGLAAELAAHPLMLISARLAVCSSASGATPAFMETLTNVAHAGFAELWRGAGFFAWSNLCLIVTMQGLGLVRGRT